MVDYYFNKEKQFKKREYIEKSPEWKEKRFKRLEIDNHKCALCGSVNNLECHHISYSRLFNEDVENDLVMLCKDCHSDVSLSSFNLLNAIEMNKYVQCSKKHIKDAVTSIIGSEKSCEILDYPYKRTTELFSISMMKHELLFGGEYNFTKSFKDLDRCLDILSKSVFEEFYDYEKTIGRNQIHSTFVLAKRKICEYLFNDLNMKKADISKKYEWTTDNIINSINKGKNPHSCYEDIANYICDSWINKYIERT